jgi:hypothetical protein
MLFSEVVVTLEVKWNLLAGLNCRHAVRNYIRSLVSTYGIVSNAIQQRYYYSQTLL